MNIQLIRPDGGTQPPLTVLNGIQHQATERMRPCLYRLSNAHQFYSCMSEDEQPARNPGIGEYFPARGLEAVVIPQAPFGRREI